jgi:hypothetical protein
MLAFIFLACLQAPAAKLAFDFTSNAHTRGGLVPLVNFPGGVTNFTYVYDVSDKAIGSVAFVEIEVTSLNGVALTSGGGNGLAVDGGENAAWLDYGEDLAFSVTLKDSVSNVVTETCNINLLSTEFRSAPLGELSFNNGSDTATVISTATGGPIPMLFDVATDGSDEEFTISRNDISVAFQFNDIELEILPEGVQSITLSGPALIEDTYLRGPDNEDTTAKNFGGQDRFQVGNGVTATAVANGLIRFPDLTGSTNLSTITRAVLRLYDYDLSNQTMDVDINAYEVSAANHEWVEGSSYEVVEPGSSCWRFLKQNTNEWAGGRQGCGIAGTDYTTNLVAAATSVDGRKGWVEFDLDMAVVQKWIDDPAENHGLVFISQGAGETGEVAFFRSCEYADAAYYPQLVLEGVAVEAGIAAAQIALMDGSKIQVSWQGQDFATFTVQRKTNLLDSAWSNVFEGITGSGPLSITNDTTAPQAFYQVIYE